MITRNGRTAASLVAMAASVGILATAANASTVPGITTGSKTTVPVVRKGVATLPPQSLPPVHRTTEEADRLLFCNRPERLTTGGAYADVRLTAGKRYRIFYHYRNASGRTAPLVVAFSGTPGKTVRLSVRKGIALPTNDPPRVGRDALQRYLAAPTKSFAGHGAVRFSTTLRPWDTASGILAVQPAQDVRLRIYFGNNNRTVPGAQVVSLEAPRRDYQITLTQASGPQYLRIGQTEKGMPSSLDGAYGLVYSVRVKAPQGRKVKVTFSPRGGQAGMVASLDGKLLTSPIVAPLLWATLTEAVAGTEPMTLVTLPFGGVFYPVELAFHLR